MNKDEVAAIILAAGQSNRMRAFKPLLPFGKTTVVDQCVDNFRQAGVETVIVVAGIESELQSHFEPTSVIVTLNPNPDSQMSDSIACGIRALPARTRAVLLTPVDHPAVPSEVVSLLIAEWERGARLVVPTWRDQGGHPVLLDLACRDELLTGNHPRGLRGLFERRRKEVKRLPVDSPYIARDMDTWDDYAALHQDVFGVLPPKAGRDQQASRCGN